MGTKVVYMRIDDARGNTVGASVHGIGATTVISSAVYPVGGRLSTVNSRVECARADPFTWTHCFHLVDGRLIERGRTPEMGEQCIPRWAQFAVASYLAGHKDHLPMECTAIDELTGLGKPSRFELTRQGTISWSVDGVEHCQYWIRSGEISASRWDDLSGCVVSDQDELFAGLPPEIRKDLVGFVKDAGRR